MRDGAPEPYPMKWFRLYDEVLNDPKVQRLPDSAFRWWVNLLCLANQGKPRGRIVPEDIPYTLRISEERAEKMVAYFTEKGLLERDGAHLVPHAWDARQFQSDNINERVAKHRRNVTGNVTKPLHVTPPDTDTDTDTEIPPLIPHGGGTYSKGFDVAWTDYPHGTNSSKRKAWEAWQKLTQEEQRAAVAALAAFKASDRWKEGYIPHASTYLNQRLWETPPQNGHRQDVDRRPAIKPAEFGPAKRMSDEKKAALREQFRREFEA